MVANDSSGPNRRQCAGGTDPVGSRNSHVPKPFQGQYCLVTGAAGFMGKYVVLKLVELGATVVATDVVASVPEFEGLRNMSYVRCDLTDPAAVQTLMFWVTYDYVFHAAGLSDPHASDERLTEVDVGGSRNLIRAVSTCSSGLPKRFVFWASGGIYDFARGTRGVAAKEGHIEDGVESGGTPISARLRGRHRSKREAELMLFKEGHELGTPVTSLRPGNVYGPHCRHGIAIDLKFAAGGGLQPFYVGPVTTRAGMVHAEDVCRAALFLARRHEAAGKAYNVCDDSSYATAVLLRRCHARLGRSFVPRVALPIGVMRSSVDRLDAKAKRLGRRSVLTQDAIDLRERDTLLDSTRLNSLGWAPKHPDSLEGLYATIGSYQKEGWL